jgi:carbon-monoxide dehydrogenase small subunit
MSELSFELNGERQTVNVDPSKPLVKTLREDLELTGTKKGCSSGACGACTVMIDGEARKSCLQLSGMIEQSNVRTIEGVADDDGLHAVQEAFLDQFSLQCGFCTPGFVISTLALLAENPDPDRREIEEALHGNICRCTGYQMIFEGVEQAAKRMSSEDVDD